MKPVSQLFNLYLSNQCSPEEVKALLHHFGKIQEDAELKSLILEELAQAAPEDFESQPEVVAVFEQTDQYLKNTLFPEKETHKFFLYRYKKYLVAAAMTGLMLGTAYLFFQEYQKGVINDTPAVVHDVQPGSSKATLVLEDGSTIALTADDSDTVLNQKGITISKTKDGMLVYEVDSKNVTSEVPAYNELRTPKGAQYEVLLPDGTRVWLNTSSSLRYPLKFAKNERRVSLSGEGYFEVEKVTVDGKRLPFFVETSRQVVQVLGTEFNISAYEDDQLVKTTLMSGIVNVSGKTGNNSKTLSPGEQSILNSDHQLSVLKVNPESARAWKNGNFLFEDVHLKEILKQFARWYNVEVDYNDIPNTRYNILVSRNETLLKVLQMLEKTGNLKFQIVNNTIKLNH
ncbi:FecR domain-containing protein [Pedobacter gandavensis]|uniref:FecR family protein n=1 Tax=Pedobacter TaxID=84567 RepID=UPI001C991FFB|nr:MULTISPECIES: FecR family protein [Pedobacter]WGQ11819.1 FecR domain-containing protein [Pedobacter gandavensis]